MSARRHRNDGSQQKPLHVWFSAPPFDLQFQRVPWSLLKIYQLRELPKRVATNKDGVSLIPVASAGLVAIVFAEARPCAHPLLFDGDAGLTRSLFEAAFGAPER